MGSLEQGQRGNPRQGPTQNPELDPRDIPELDPTDIPELGPTDIPELGPTDIQGWGPTGIQGRNRDIQDCRVVLRAGWAGPGTFRRGALAVDLVGPQTPCWVELAQSRP